MQTKTPPQLPELGKVPSRLRIHCGEAGEVSLLAAAPTPEGEKPPLRRFTMTAYTGGAMQLAGWRYPVVVDLAGLNVSKKSRPILKDHQSSQIVGHTDAIALSETKIDVAGVVSGAGATAEEIIATSENGFPWQASLGASASRVVFIAEGRTGRANGREFAGPVYIARRSVLGEVSFVALGADDDTFAQVAAGKQEDSLLEVTTLEFEQWASDNDLDLSALGDANLSGLKAMFAAQQDQTPPNPPPLPPTEPSLPPTEEHVIDPPIDPVIAMRTKLAAEHRRVATIQEVCDGKHPNIEAEAIENGWDKTKTELAVLRAERPSAPAVHSRTSSLTSKVLEAAACLSLQFDEAKLLREYGEQTLDAADSMRDIGFKELVAACARLEGKDIPLTFGDGKVTIKAGFSTVSLPGILENVMNKSMLEAYETTPIAAFEFCSVSTVSDFKEISRHRLLGTGGFEPIAPDGELKHGKLSEQKYTNKAKTYGQMLILTREDVINDDLQAFMAIPIEMGRNGAATIDEQFFQLLLSNPGSFFGAGNGNYLTGADTAFGPDSLTEAKTLFRKQKAGPGAKEKDKRPINIRPELLVVPVELETEAELLMGASQLMIDGSGAATKIPVDNPHRNKYRIVSAPHLSDSYYTGNSAKAWYLFANPKILAAFEIVFLNGRRTPIIERVEAAPNSLGMGFRGYIDFGVNVQDPRGAVKVKGAA